MPEEEKEQDKLNRLEEMKSRLWSNNYQTRIEHHSFFPKKNNTEVPDSWEKGEIEHEIKEQNKFLMKTSIFKKFFIFSIIFFILAVGYASYMFFVGGNTVSNDNIDVSVLGKTFTTGGEDLPLIVEIINKNKSSLDLVDLVVEYPTGVSTGTSKATERIRKSLGTINSGATHNENIKLVLYGEQGSIHEVKIFLEYRVAGSNSIFVKEKSIEINIDATPINLLVFAPSEISPNQDLVFKVKAALNANRPVSKMLLVVDYPPGFEFISSVPVPTSGNNIFSLGDLAPGAEKDIEITGKMVDVYDGEEKAFKVSSGGESLNDKNKIGVVFNSLKHNLIIKRPFIEATLSINGVTTREYATDSKSNINGQIHWANNLDTKINDLEIRAKITGNGYNRKSILTNDGFYNSLDGDTIIWDKNSISEFREVSPGDDGSVSFSLSPLPLYSAQSGLLGNPTIKIEVSIIGKQAQEGNTINVLNNFDSKIIKIITDAGFSNKGLYYSGHFKNTGPVPPVVSKETTYTVVWSVSNTANTISKAQIKSTLPPYIRYIGTTFPTGADITFNQGTRELVWNIGTINKGASITNTAKEVSFQVGFTPSLSQLDTTPIIINEAILTGHDDFANVNVSVKKGALNTRLGSDPQFITSGAKVVE